MKNFLAVIGALVLIIAVTGWVLGWYSFKHAPPSPNGDGKSNIQVNVDHHKIKEDGRLLGFKLSELLSRPKGSSEQDEEFVGPKLPENQTVEKSEPKTGTESEAEVPPSIFLPPPPPPAPGGLPN